MAMLKARTARSEVSHGRKAVPNKVQVVIEATPIAKKIRTWSTMLSGKLAIAAQAVMVPITAIQPLTFTHWNIAAPQKVIGPRPVSPGLGGPDIAIITAR